MSAGRCPGVTVCSCRCGLGLGYRDGDEKVGERGLRVIKRE